MIPLGGCVAVEKRYVRSINLERDLDVASSLDGYTITPRVASALERISSALKAPGTARSWTVTGVYGSGKSAFAHFVASLHGPKSLLRTRALALLRSEAETASLAGVFNARIPSEGLVRAVVVGRREPVAHSVLRALDAGAQAFWSKRKGVRPKILQDIHLLHSLVSKGGTVDTSSLAEMTLELANASRTGVLLVIDELGKILEDAARSGGARDLFLLQQLAELSAGQGKYPIVLVSLLHQAFSEYGSGLGSAERSEWEKIHGRFEDIAFTGPAEEMLHLVGKAIVRSMPSAVEASVKTRSVKWHSYLVRCLPDSYPGKALRHELINAAYPLHPITALVLPSLCARYAQNDRSLFTFLSSSEPHSLKHFLDSAQASPRDLPLLRLDCVYDYFVNVIGGGLSPRPQFQRWAEVHGIVRESQGLPHDELVALKVVATLNLLSTTGPMRASRALVIAALLETPEDVAGEKRWGKALEGLLARRLMTHRSQVDEFRVWEGSDFDVEAAAREQREAERRSLADILSDAAPLRPAVAQRHSFKTGTLRYFERQFSESNERLASIQCSSNNSDGLIVYWVGEVPPAAIPASAPDGRPVVVAQIEEPAALKSVVLELAALRAVERSSTELQSDGVARREVRMRIRLAQEVLDAALAEALEPSNLSTLWVEGERAEPKRFRALLSAVCDRVYDKGPELWNELINRRDLTSQGAKAQRELVEGLVRHPDRERFGLQGEGPAYSMYASMFRKTGIHRCRAGIWGLHAPREAGLREVWQATEKFCLDSRETSRSLDQLYALLEAPPYGTKRGLIPVLLAAVLMVHEEDVTVYRDGTFIPSLGSEHFEILVKQPARFAVKHFTISGLRRELFRDLEAMISSTKSMGAKGARNATLLSVVRPLVRFATSLPRVTRNSGQLGKVVGAVRDALLTASEPDRLVFESLPKACGHPPFLPNDRALRSDYQTFRQRLQSALRELDTHYESLLDQCRSRLHVEFGIKSGPDALREDLRIRAQYVVNQCIEPRLKSFILAASRPDVAEREWLESLVMIVADKPLETWSDADSGAFEVNAGDLARRFANLEALQKEAARNHEAGFEARRITITRADGTEFSDLVWLDADQGKSLDGQVELLLGQLRSVNPEHQRRAIAVTLLERLIGKEPLVASATDALRDGKAKHG